MKNWYYLATYGLCDVHYYIRNSGGKMNCRFNIITAVTYRIECILKAVFEFMLLQITKSKSNSSNTFDSDCIMAITKRIKRRPCEF